MSYKQPRLGLSEALVDWENSGTPGDGDYDNTTDDLDYGTPLIIEVGRDADRTFGRPRAALSSWRWRNYHRRYSRENVESPLRGLLQTGRRVWLNRSIGSEILMDDASVLMDDSEGLMSGFELYRLFTGTLREPKEQYGPGPGKRWVAVNALGAMAKLLAAGDVSIALQTDITTGAYAVLVLEAAGLTEDDYVVDQEMVDNGRVLDWVYASRVRPFEELQRVWASEGPTAAFYEDQYGRAVLEGNTYLADNARGNTVQATFYADGTDGLGIVGIEPLPRDDTIINDVTFQAELRATQSTTQVWEYSGSIALSASQSVTIIASVSDPLAAHTTPQLTTDYTVTGTALASVTSTALGPLAVAITFTAGAGSATVGPPAGGNGPRLRGQPHTLISAVEVTPTVDASDSQDEYGVRSLPSSIPRPLPGLRPTEMAGVADAWILTYEEGRPAYRVTVVNKTAEVQRQQLTRQISDLIEVVDPTESGASMQLTIHSIRHEIRGDHLHLTTFGCEQRIEQSWGRYDVALYDQARYGQ